MIIKIKSNTELYNYYTYWDEGFNEKLGKVLAHHKALPKDLEKELKSISTTLESLDDDLKESIDKMKKSFNSLLDD